MEPEQSIGLFYAFFIMMLAVASSLCWVMAEAIGES